MKAAIRGQALELGFDDCRFTTADAPDHAADFEAWIADRRHGEMGYLERNAHKRVDPQLVLPGAKTIITFAASYATAENRKCEIPRATKSGGASRNPTPHGVIARYARFSDYHDTLADNLKILTASVNSLGGSGDRSLWYVDTGPLLERDFAQRAGIGFVGKHTNVISRSLGNWIFLAEIVTTVTFAPDAPEKNRCGSCTRCLTACPTAAITAPFQLDARRCISYLTIEFRGSIPLELRSAIGDRIYGCDDCLAVCPWNRFAREGKLMREHSRPELAAPDLIELLALDEAGFKKRFAGTPILRAKRRGLRRNVCVALGNVGDATALPALRTAAADPEPLVSEHAEWAIQQIAQR
jgi:epoxyqueuosine reductase